MKTDTPANGGARHLKPILINKTGGKMKKGKAITRTTWDAEKRRAYQAEYYKRNREKALKYQRRYHRLHKKSKRVGAGSNVWKYKDIPKTALTRSDLMYLPMDSSKSLKVLQDIIDGSKTLC